MSAFSQGHITPGHVTAFQVVRSPFYDNITLTSCWINGEPGVVIVVTDEVREGKVAVMPLFVAITPGMDLRFEGEGESGGGGGPRRPDEEFEAAEAEICPTPT